jgi:hypothetical protein
VVPQRHTAKGHAAEGAIVITGNSFSRKDIPYPLPAPDASGCRLRRSALFRRDAMDDALHAPFLREAWRARDGAIPK